MSASVSLAFTVALLLVAYRIFSVYTRGGYVCPSCGTRQAGKHSETCAWHR
jgi:hypothetical protein